MFRKSKRPLNKLKDTRPLEQEECSCSVTVSVWNVESSLYGRDPWKVFMDETDRDGSSGRTRGVEVVRSLT